MSNFDLPTYTHPRDLTTHTHKGSINTYTPFVRICPLLLVKSHTKFDKSQLHSSEKRGTSPLRSPIPWTTLAAFESVLLLPVGHRAERRHGRVLAGPRSGARFWTCLRFDGYVSGHGRPSPAHERGHWAATSAVSSEVHKTASQNHTGIRARIRLLRYA